MAAVDKEGEFTMEIIDSPPAHLLIRIESFSKLSKHGIHKQESSKFVAGDYKWRLIIYPQDSGGSNVSVFLAVAETESLPEGWEITADCSILIRNLISDNYFCFRGKARHFDGKSWRWGFSMCRWGFSMCSRMLEMCCNGYDTFTFGAEVFLRNMHVNECLSLHDWKILDFTKLEGVWTSHVFRAGGFRWKMKLYPNGNGDGEGKSISIYLECVDSETFAPHEKVKAELCLRLKNKSPRAHLSKHTSMWFTKRDAGRGRGFSGFVPITDMCDPSKGFIIDGCCFLEAEISVQDAAHEPEIKLP